MTDTPTNLVELAIYVITGVAGWLTRELQQRNRERKKRKDAS